MTFSSGFADGAELCALVTAHFDNLVESDEDFSVNLTLVSPVEASFGVGNVETAINLMDSESMTS